MCLEPCRTSVGGFRCLCFLKMEDCALESAMSRSRIVPPNPSDYTAAARADDDSAVVVALRMSV